MRCRGAGHCELAVRLGLIACVSLSGYGGQCRQTRDIEKGMEVHFRYLTFEMRRRTKALVDNLLSHIRQVVQNFRPSTGEERRRYSSAYINGRRHRDDASRSKKLPTW